MTVLESAVEHYARQQRISAAGLIAIRRERGGPLAVARLITAFQLLAARDASSSVGLMLEEQDIDAPAAGTVSAGALAGVASDGRPLSTLVSLDQAESPAWLEMAAVSQIQDAARAAASLAIAARPAVNGWVRMMNPPSCSRCAVLAGRFFRWNQGFARHPRCDCRHIPSQEADYSDVRLSGDKWFHDLSPGEQDRIFTKAGAQAVRDGADLGQVVNARRGMSTAQIGNRRAVVSTEGTTRRGLASRARTGRNMSQRVMPETIYDIARDREDAIRLLKLNGFIL